MYLFYPLLLMLVLFTVAPLSMADRPLFPTSVAMSQAATLYRQNCSVCHGEQGDGQSRARFGLDPQPRDFTSVQSALELNRVRMIDSVTYGRSATAMVAWGDRLSTVEIAGVVDYIRQRFMRSEIKQEEVAALDPRWENGKRIYEGQCRVCHGDNGSGSRWTTSVLSPAPRNFTTPLSRHELDDERMIHAVTNGRQGTAMISFSERLSTTDIEDVVDYIRGAFMRGAIVVEGERAHTPPHPGARASSAVAGSGMTPHKPQPPQAVADMTLPFPGEWVGDVEKGRGFYRQNCSGCHGMAGDGNGPRASFINPKPRNFLHSESRRTFNRPALFKAIVIGKPGTVMPAWGKVLGPQQVADVAEYLFQRFIHPAAALDGREPPIKKKAKAAQHD